MIGLFVGALVLRWIHLLTIRQTPFFEYLILDPRMYDEWAREIASGAWLGERPFFQDPLYAYLLAIGYRIFGHHYTPVVAIQTLLGAAIAPLLYGAARPWFGRVAGAVSGTIAALYLPAIFYEGMILKTGGATFLVTATLALISIASLRGGAIRWFSSGVVLGLACLTRGNLVLIVPVLAVWALLDSGSGVERRSFNFGTPRSRVAAIALVLGAVLVLGSTAIRNRVVGGEWILTTSNAGQNFFIGNQPGNRTGQYAKLPFIDANPKYEETGFAREARARTGRELTPSEVSRFWFGRSLDWIRSDPGAWMALEWRKFRVFWGAFEVPDNLDYYLYRDSAPVLGLPLPGFGLIAPLGLLGAGLCLRRRGWPRALVLFVAVYSASVIAFFVFSRFRMPMMPALYVLAGHAVAETARKIRSIRAGDTPARSLTVPVLAFVLLFSFVNLPVRAHAQSLGWRVAEAIGLPRRLETSAQGHFNLGVAYAARVGDSEDADRMLELAESELRVALADEDRYASSHVELAKVLARQGRNAEALTLYLRAVELEPGNYRTHHAVGLIRRRLGDLAGSEAAFRHSLGLEPRHTASALRLGEVLLAMDRPREAEESFAHALRLSPNNQAAREGIAAARLRSGSR